jgi:hypothetical protein
MPDSAVPSNIITVSSPCSKEPLTAKSTNLLWIPKLRPKPAEWICRFLRSEPTPFRARMSLRLALTCCPRGIDSSPALAYLHRRMTTLVGQPDSFRANWVSSLILKAVYSSSFLQNSLFLLFQVRLMVFWKMYYFPILVINCIVWLLLCLASMALESPTLAQVNLEFCSNITPIKVEPLAWALIYLELSSYVWIWW